MKPRTINAKILGLTLALLAATAGGVTALAWAANRQPREVSVPYYGSRDFTPSWTGTSHHIPSFSLVAQSGAPFTSADVAGRVHVVSFIYPRCSVICPRIVGNLLEVQRQVTDPRFEIVSYTVTPDLDTPEVLAAYGRENAIDPRRWRLVTGDKHQIYSLARDAYFADDGRLDDEAGSGEGFLHTEKLLLIDGEGQIRGVYNGTQRFDVEHLIADASTLLAELSE